MNASSKDLVPLQASPLACAIVAVALSSLFTVTACGSAPGTPDGGPRPDGGLIDGGSTDAGSGSMDAGSTDAGSTDAGSTDAGRLDEHGFLVRRPQARTVPCMDQCGAAMVELPEQDSLCTFKLGSIDGFVYFQATPTSAGFVNNTYEAAAWVSIGGQVHSVAAAYDYGHHHNDTLSFTWQGVPYRYSHSSLGFGGRACQPMDCLQGFSGDALTDDGCTPARTHPVVCVLIADDGTAPPLVDHFAKCKGDPNP